MKERACWSVNRDRQAVRHAVGHTQELEPERTDGHDLPGRHGHQPVPCVDSALFELGLHEREREPRRVDGPGHAVDDVRDCPDVVFVPVGEHEGGDAAAVGLESREIGNDQVHPEELRLGKHHTRVDEQGRVTAGDEQHVHAELAESSERNDIHRRRAGAIGRDQRATSTRRGRRAALVGKSAPAVLPGTADGPENRREKLAEL